MKTWKKKKQHKTIKIRSRLATLLGECSALLVVKLVQVVRNWCTFMIDLLLGFPWYHVVGTISYFQMKFYKIVVDDATYDKFRFVWWYEIVLMYSIGSSGFGCYVQDFLLCYDWQHRIWWTCSYYTLSFDNVCFHEVV